MDVRDRIAGLRAVVDALNAAEDELIQFDMDVKYVGSRSLADIRQDCSGPSKRH